MAIGRHVCRSNISVGVRLPEFDNSHNIIRSNVANQNSVVETVYTLIENTNGTLQSSYNSFNKLNKSRPNKPKFITLYNNNTIYIIMSPYLYKIIDCVLYSQDFIVLVMMAMVLIFH